MNKNNMVLDIDSISLNHRQDLKNLGFSQSDLICNKVALMIYCQVLLDQRLNFMKLL